MEEKTASRPRQLWNQALRAVKGDNTQQLIERFTSQMTLVAEGLADDQSGLHRELERLDRALQKTSVDLSNQADSNRHDLQQDLQQQSERMDELKQQQKQLSAQMKEMEKRLASMEDTLKSKKAADSRRNEKKSLIQQATLPILCICATVIIVAVLRLF